MNYFPAPLPVVVSDVVPVEPDVPVELPEVPPLVDEEPPPLLVPEPPVAKFKAPEPASSRRIFT